MMLPVAVAGAVVVGYVLGILHYRAAMRDALRRR